VRLLIDEVLFPDFVVERTRLRHGLLRRFLLGRRRGFAAAAVILPLDNARRLAAPAAQIIELGAADLAAAQDFDRVDHRRVQRKDALNALAVGNLAHGEILVESRAGAADADAFIGLHARPLALDDLDVDSERVAGPEVRNVLAGG